jgi:hypothetical protein
MIVDKPESSLLLVSTSQSLMLTALTAVMISPTLAYDGDDDNDDNVDDNDDDDYNNEVYLRLQHGKGFYNHVYMSYVKHINPAKGHK